MINITTEGLMQALDALHLEKGKHSLKEVAISAFVLKADGAQNGEKRLKEYYINRNGGKVVKGITYPRSSDYDVIKAATSLVAKHDTMLAEVLALAKNQGQAIAELVERVAATFCVDDNVYFAGQFLPTLITGKDAATIADDYAARVAGKVSNSETNAIASTEHGAVKPKRAARSKSAKEAAQSIWEQIVALLESEPASDTSGAIIRLLSEVADAIAVKNPNFPPDKDSEILRCKIQPHAEYLAKMAQGERQARQDAKPVKAA